MKAIQLAIAAILFCSTVSIAANTNTVADVYTQDKASILVSPKHPEFAIKLKSNPTTGYSWFLREYNSNLLTPTGHRFEAGNANLVGSPGFEVWTFKVKPEAFTVPQQTQLRLVYSRPWAGMENTTQAVFRVSTSTK